MLFGCLLSKQFALPKLGLGRTWRSLTLCGGFAPLWLLLLLWAVFGTCIDFTTPRELHQCQSPPSRQALKPDCFIPLLIKSTRHENEFSSPSFLLFFFFPLISPRKEDLIFFLIHPKETTATTTAITYIYLLKKPKNLSGNSFTFFFKLLCYM